MNKLSILAAAGLLSLGLAGAVTPSFAASIASCENNVQLSDGNYTDQIDQDSAAIFAGLKQKGIDVQSIGNDGGCVKAEVQRPNGSLAMEFFDPNSLQRLHVNG